MDKAIDLLEQAVAQNPSMSEALFALGRAYAAVGKTEQAAATLQEFLNTNPPTVWADEAKELLVELGAE
jgi:cytochrome c-type biogenesis protein CcmH/NrfG